MLPPRLKAMSPFRPGKVAEAGEPATVTMSAATVARKAESAIDRRTSIWFSHVGSPAPSGRRDRTNNPKSTPQWQGPRVLVRRPLRPGWSRLAVPTLRLGVIDFLGDRLHPRPS